MFYLQSFSKARCQGCHRHWNDCANARQLLLRFRTMTTKSSLSFLIVGLLLTSAVAPSAQAASTLIVNAQIVDGTGSVPKNGAVRIERDTIVAIGDLKAHKGEKVINAKGLTLSPGFIDTHSHHDVGLDKHRDALAAVSQGITTIIVGQDGEQSYPLSKAFAAFKAKPAAVNIASYAGHNSIRAKVMGKDFKREAKPEEIAKMAEMLRSEMRAGALGMSTGLEYDPGIYSSKAEVITLAKVLPEFGGRYISHMRSEDVAIDDALEEIITIGREAKVPVQVSHIKLAIVSKWGKSEEFIARMEKARAEGVDITADVYPYEYWQSTLGVLFPKRDFTDVKAAEFALTQLSTPEGMLISRYDADKSLVGKTISQIAKERGTLPAETYLELINTSIAKKAEEMVIGTSMDSQDIARFITWQHSNICSDGGLVDGHPRGAGSFTRVLRKQVRETKSLSVEQAIFRMTKNAANHVGITGRGTIAVGNKADLVLFDPTTVSDHATIKDPAALSTGITNVWVNGRIVLANRKSTGAFPGVVIKRSSTPEYGIRRQ
jgi:N-acyl-D-amino-acid deacylase